MASYRVTYCDADGYRTERVIQADRVVDSAGMTTFRVLTQSATTSSSSRVEVVVWRVPTARVESYYDLGPG